MPVLENVFSDDEHDKTPTLQRIKGEIIHRGGKVHKSVTPRTISTNRRPRYGPKRIYQRNMIPSTSFNPVQSDSDENSDTDVTRGNRNPSVITQTLHGGTVNPQRRDSVMGKVDQKALDLLQRVGLHVVTISHLSLSINADMKDVIFLVSGKAAPKKIGGWFNFEIVRKSIFAVAFTAEQAGFEDFTENMFNTKLGLFNALEQTTVSHFCISIFLAAIIIWLNLCEGKMKCIPCSD